MKRNLTTTKSGPGRLHKDGVKQSKRRKRMGAMGGFSKALVDWITQQNLKQMAIRLSKKQFKGI